ncbi:uncharacterized protein LOC108682570 isoform X2 [Hyalella azteca]|uniref:Uncharacterized protein LOC108682570 isoform X2 n=1 Tax=Hyalella azteca TaxID=294128 RepID=A0A8B7PPL8_HYAAZ|nr:uncharacterized protein LOC108682570 isoform X2 [Hyalella azteca]
MLGIHSIIKAMFEKHGSHPDPVITMDLRRNGSSAVEILPFNSTTFIVPDNLVPVFPETNPEMTESCRLINSDNSVSSLVPNSDLPSRRENDFVSLNYDHPVPSCDQPTCSPVPSCDHRIDCAVENSSTPFRSPASVSIRSFSSMARIKFNEIGRFERGNPNEKHGPRDGSTSLAFATFDNSKEADASAVDCNLKINEHNKPGLKMKNYKKNQWLYAFRKFFCVRNTEESGKPVTLKMVSKDHEHFCHGHCSLDASNTKRMSLSQLIRHNRRMEFEEARKNVERAFGETDSVDGQRSSQTLIDISSDSERNSPSSSAMPQISSTALTPSHPSENNDPATNLEALEKSDPNVSCQRCGVRRLSGFEHSQPSTSECMKNIVDLERQTNYSDTNFLSSVSSGIQDRSMVLLESAVDESLHENVASVGSLGSLNLTCDGTPRVPRCVKSNIRASSYSSLSKPTHLHEASKCVQLSESTSSFPLCDSERSTEHHEDSGQEDRIYYVLKYNPSSQLSSEASGEYEHFSAIEGLFSSQSDAGMFFCSSRDSLREVEGDANEQNSLEKKFVAKPTDLDAAQLEHEKQKSVSR